MFKIIRKTLFMMSLGALLVFSGCKGQQEMQTKIAELDTKIQDSNKKLSSMEADLKSALKDISQLKSLISKLGDVVVNLEKAEEERVKKATAAPAKKHSHASKATKKKATHKKH